MPRQRHCGPCTMIEVELLMAVSRPYRARVRLGATIYSTWANSITVIWNRFNSLRCVSQAERIRRIGSFSLLQVLGWSSG
jgi:hypothetical protein